MNQPLVKTFFHEGTNTFSHVVSDPDTGSCAIIDPVLDYEAASGNTSSESGRLLADYIESAGLVVEWIIETHVHADHLSAAPWLRDRLGGRIAIGEHVSIVQEAFGELFNEGPEFYRDGRQFDHRFADGERYQVGSMKAQALHTPGHTPACMCHLIGDALFVGDTLFMPDFGTARCDFPGGDAGELYDSIQKIFSLPDSTRMFLCHDYKAPGRDAFAWETTVGEQKARNVHVSQGISREAFVETRTRRDANLPVPRLILPSVQVNMRAGNFPGAESNGISYLKVPLDAFETSE